jgi:hypothetical protein
VRAFNNDIRALLRAPSIKMRILMTFFLDSGTYYFCDDTVNVSDGIRTWVGANALGSAIEMRSGRDLSAEPITLQLDGNHMTQAGINDPAKVLAQIMTYLFTQDRVDIAWGFAYPDSYAIQLTIPVAAMKINTCRLIDNKLDWSLPGKETNSVLEITLDSLAMRYSRATWRTRSHADQQEIDATDMFFSFTADAQNTERNLYWGKSAPSASSAVGSGTGIGGTGGTGRFGGIRRVAQ